MKFLHKKRLVLWAIIVVLAVVTLLWKGIDMGDNILNQIAMYKDIVAIFLLGFGARWLIELFSIKRKAKLDTNKYLVQEYNKYLVDVSIKILNHIQNMSEAFVRLQEAELWFYAERKEDYKIHTKIILKGHLFISHNLPSDLEEEAVHHLDTIWEFFSYLLKYDEIPRKNDDNNYPEYQKVKGNLASEKSFSYLSKIVKDNMFHKENYIINLINSQI